MNETPDDGLMRCGYCGALIDDPGHVFECSVPRDEVGRVLCPHGRPIMCNECGEEYANELNGPAGGARADALAKSSQSTGTSDPSVPLSAIRALVQQWREKAEAHEKHGDCYRRGKGWAMVDCADELAALCPAPPEDQP